MSAAEVRYAAGMIFGPGRSDLRRGMAEDGIAETGSEGA